MTRSSRTGSGKQLDIGADDAMKGMIPVKLVAKAKEEERAFIDKMGVFGPSPQAPKRLLRHRDSGAEVWQAQAVLVWNAPWLRELEAGIKDADSSTFRVGCWKLVGTMHGDDVSDVRAEDC